MMVCKYLHNTPFFGICHNVGSGSEHINYITASIIFGDYKLLHCFLTLREFLSSDKFMIFHQYVYFLLIIILSILLL